MNKSVTTVGTAALHTLELLHTSHAFVFANMTRKYLPFQFSNRAYREKMYTVEIFNCSHYSVCIGIYGKWKYSYPFINKIFRTPFRFFSLFSILFEIFIHIKGLCRIIHVLACTVNGSMVILL